MTSVSAAVPEFTRTPAAAPAIVACVAVNAPSTWIPFHGLASVAETSDTGAAAVPCSSRRPGPADHVQLHVRIQLQPYRRADLQAPADEPLGDRGRRERPHAVGQLVAAREFVSEKSPPALMSNRAPAAR